MPDSFGEVDAVEFSDAMESPATVDEQQAQIVERRFFAGLTVEGVAESIGVSTRKIEADWTHAKAWLGSKLDPDASK